MGMIAVDEAKSIILENLWHSSVRHMPLIEAQELTLAGDVYAHTDIPAYPQSSMDGYAFAFSDCGQVMQVVGEMAAGAARPLRLLAGQAARIFTGAPLPEGADTVVMQEKVVVENGRLTITDGLIKFGANVRQRGAEIVKGARALPAGSLLSPGAAGFLAGIGIAEVPVFTPPRVTVVVTGTELQSPGQLLRFGGVYESNSVTLGFALRKAGIREIRIVTTQDHLGSLSEVLRTALEESEIVLLTGGVSVGDYDFVAEAAAACSVEKKFHGVKQKPGKPLYFGRRDQKPGQSSQREGKPALVFGLPGNPASALTCFYLYVLPAIEVMQQQPGMVQVINAELTEGYSKPPGLTHFLKARVAEGKVTLLSGQESFRLSAFAEANCLARLEEGRETYQPGDTVRVYMLPA